MKNLTLNLSYSVHAWLNGFKVASPAAWLRQIGRVARISPTGEAHLRIRL
jgi:hypothetical protein